jgi:GR25 family glycosyltransferase involved in LPS biosynthesis
MMQSFIITLMERPDSVRHAQECAKSCSSFGIPAQLHPGFFLDAGNDFLQSKGISIRKNLIPRLIKKMSARGVVGCFASHFSLWEMCAAQTETYLILEEDALMVRKLPDYAFDGVLSLDPLLADRSDYLQAFWELQKQEIDEVSEDSLVYFNMTTDGESFRYMHGGYAYLIKPQAASRLVRATCERGYLAADVMINDATVPVSCVAKSVFLHRPRGYSLSRTV